MTKKPTRPRVFLLVLDSFGIGELPDAAKFSDEGSNTLRAVCRQKEFFCPNLSKMGLFHIGGVAEACGVPAKGAAEAAYGKMAERSAAKDTTVGHWEIAGLITDAPFPTYPEGFPANIIEEFEKQTGRKVLCNRPYSGTEVIKDFGEEQKKTGSLIVYTSADSVFQIAAHEESVPVEELYRYCGIARKILCGKHAVGRVIARPFAGTYPFFRTGGRRDFSLSPPEDTLLDAVKNAGLSVISVGKIRDIFAGKGITKALEAHTNRESMEQTAAAQKEDFEGLCFTNLVEFDSVYGHRNDAPGYARALTEFDAFLGGFLRDMRADDLLILTADHGCDPVTPSTDHSREYVPLLICGKGIKKNVDLGTRQGFSDVAATILEAFGIHAKTAGVSFWKEIVKEEK